MTPSWPQRRGAPPHLSSTHRREFEKVFDVGKYRAIEPLDLRIGRFDDIVFVWGVRTAAVAESEMARRQTQWVTRKHVARPGAGRAGPQHRVRARPTIHRHLRPDQPRVR